MRTLVFLHAFALVCVHSRSMKDAENKRSICGEDSVLRCKANSLPGVKYRSVRWYKLGEEPYNKESGLLMKRLSPNSTTLWYAGLERKVELLADDSFDILLPNVTAVDSGRYKCLLAAPVGEQNQEGQVHLRVTGCVDNKSTDQSESNTILVLSIVGLVAALLIFTISYVTVMNMLLQRSKKNPQEPLLDAPFEKKDFMLIYTLGPNWSGQASIKHVCV
ncbi:CD83 antigen [Salmo salar]|uniref:CD83 antigen n=1 Tax=Salmo salar TaxID=8030 RepID=B5XET8_SALSA|nr:CD83 antigen [Salmo salar]ACI69358.1 CD83 antigen precursor [Salmo salar]|eukprot:XP_014056375.1 PREDICTED: CD83 antigen-like [Salmo salar]